MYGVARSISCYSKAGEDELFKNLLQLGKELIAIRVAVSRWEWSQGQGQGGRLALRLVEVVFRLWRAVAYCMSVIEWDVNLNDYTCHLMCCKTRRGAWRSPMHAVWVTCTLYVWNVDKKISAMLIVPVVTLPRSNVWGLLLTGQFHVLTIWLSFCFESTLLLNGKNGDHVIGNHHTTK